ncbi:hypothetical protein PN36_16480, partial [Candidatus Thiomargarita nelsonii]
MKSIKHIATGAIIQQVLSIIIFMILTRNLGAAGYGMVLGANLALTSQTLERLRLKHGEQLEQW